MKMKIRNKAAFTDEVTPLETENSQISLEAALEGIVLLENDGSLPLHPGKIALYGAGADMTIKGGTGSGEVNERHCVSILEGLESAGFTVTTKNWIHAYSQEYKQGEKAYAAGFAQRLKQTDIVNVMAGVYPPPFGPPVTSEDIRLSDTDTCVYVIARQAGEGADRRLDRHDYSLSESEKSSLALCAANYEKMIVVINTGSVFDLSFLDEIDRISAVIYFAQQGMRGGDAFASILCGNVSPSAKTVDTWPKKYEDIPFAMDYSYLNGNTAEEYYREGIYVGYRYFDSFHIEPRYPFGYGLSYTTFSMQPATPIVDGSQITLSVKVTNTGDTCAGKEIVQLYVSCPHAALTGEYQKLVAFAKTKLLSPGESEFVTLAFDLKDLASYHEEIASFLLEKGDYILRCGSSSRNTSPVAVLVLNEDIITEQCTNICSRREPLPEIEPTRVPAAAEAEQIYLDCITIQSADIRCEKHTYQEPNLYSSPTVDAIMNGLSDKELCTVVTGAGMMSGGPRFFDAPGSAGYTTGKFLKKGLPNICLADGPAGLRPQKTSAVSGSGHLKGVEPMISGLNYVPGFVKKMTLGNPQKSPCVYQFTTSFPTGLALAQSWNTELMERVGTAVGNEMARYGVTFWLAPGMNIHRNPLCGRNFEYYSEDPLLSGKMAASLSRGVQSVRGCYVTIKHFCCNNQEDNRNYMNANISERALREIYLKGFQIAIEEGGARAVMSSYNKVNGIYTNNSYDLLTRVLRNEWNFEGLVMTDWFATGKKVGNHAAAINAGNDLIMPGGKDVIRELVSKLKSGELDRAALKRCAANVILAVTESRIYHAYRKMELSGHTEASDIPEADSLESAEESDVTAEAESEDINIIDNL